MGENLKIVFVEGPQGSGKTTAASYIESFGYRLIRGIPTSNFLIENSERKNWEESLAILNKHMQDEKPFVMDRSIWSLAVFMMRKRREYSNLVYRVAKNMFYRRMMGTQYKVLVLLSPAHECIKRANPDSLLSLKNIRDVEDEIFAYQRLIDQLNYDGIEVCAIYNQNISLSDFFNRIARLLSVIYFFCFFYRLY